VADDNAERIAALQSRIGRRFPLSFLNFISRYSFPAFEFGPLLFFANHREETHWELSRKLFLDPVMSPLLLGAGFIQVGNPFFYNYDPVCFDCNPGTEEPLLVLGLEVFMTVGRSGWVVLGVFILGSGLLTQAGKSGDLLLLRGLIWGAILLAVGYQTVNVLRRKGHYSTDITAGLPPSWRRWILGESNKS
jgi:hypothetical protein